jgi:hypothetical protein
MLTFGLEFHADGNLFYKTWPANLNDSWRDFWQSLFFKKKFLY